MTKAAERGHEFIMRLCHDEWGTTDVNNAMAQAKRNHHKAIVVLCQNEWGAE
jgi:hypothetical protein